PAHVRLGTGDPAAGLPVADVDGLGRNVVADHGPGDAVVRRDVTAPGRNAALEVLVQRVFVLQATHQPPAGPGDLQGVQRQILILGHPDTDRLEIDEERGTAGVAPARPDPALDSRLVPRA